MVFNFESLGLSRDANSKEKTNFLMKGIPIISNYLPGLQLQFYPQHFSDIKFVCDTF